MGVPSKSLGSRALINIDVPTLQPAIDFYAAAVGTRLQRVLDDDVAELSYGSSVIYLLCKGDGSGATPSNSHVRGFGRHWTPVHVDFVVNDIAEAVARASAAGAKQESECIGWRGSKCVTFSDPFGHGFCLIEFALGSYE